MRVLVADDDPVWRKILGKRIHGWGYEVVSANNGEQALAEIQQPGGPRIAVIDWQMPGLDGLTICGKVKQSLQIPFTYIIMLTSRDAKEDFIEGLSAGADEYLTKPVDMEILRSRLGVAKRIVRSVPPPEWSTPKAPGYRVERLLGRGSSGTVWRAVQEKTGLPVALKIIRLDLVTHEEHRRFKREIQIAETLDHPNIARIYGSDTDEKQCYFAMELVDGPDLRSYVLKEKPDRWGLVELMIQVCRGVGHAHDHDVVHRDLKPQNILVTAEGVPKVVDFGIAKLTAGKPEGDKLQTLQGVALGTPVYMAPEQASGRPDEADARTDVYALGVILYALLIRKHPHPLTGLSASEVMNAIAHKEIRRPTKFVPEFPVAWEKVLLKALAKKPSGRYATAGELASALAGLGEEGSTDRGIKGSR